jgi:hypothetical protein
MKEPCGAASGTGRARGLVGVVAAALVLACGCSSTPSQLLVRLDSDLATDREPPVEGDLVLRAVRVLVCEESCDRAAAPRDERLWAVTRVDTAGRVRLPASFGVAPREGAASGTVEIVVEALRRSEPGASEALLFSTRRWARVESGRRTDVSIFLSAGCLSADCGPGETCDDAGECVPHEVPDAGVPADAGLDAATVLDAQSFDAPELDAPSAPDAPLAPDAPTLDAPALDAPALDAPALDAGADASVICAPAPGPGPSVPSASSEMGLSSGGISAATRTRDGSLLVAGSSRSAFVWAGASSPGPAFFVSRLGVAGTPSWTTFFSFDPARSSSYSSITRVLEEGDRVYIAGQAPEAWTSGTLVIPEVVTGSPTDSRRFTPRLVGLDASTGAPLWAHTFKRLGTTEFATSLAADADGVWMTTRGFGSAGTFLLDGRADTVDRGTDVAYAHLVQVSPGGAVRFVHGIGGASVADARVATLDGDAIVLVSGGFDATTPIAGLDALDGEIVLARLDASGAVVWRAAIDCTVGDWSVGSSAMAVAHGRVWLGWGASTPSSAETCTALTVRGEGASPVIARASPARGWLGALSLDACDGARTSDPIWLGTVSSSAFFGLSNLSASARGIAVGGFLSRGGADLGGGTVAGRETGSGTDGFVALLGYDARPVFTWITGASESRTYPDDFVDDLILGTDRLEVVGTWSGAQTLGSLDIAAGGRLVELELP